MRYIWIVHSSSASKQVRHMSRGRNMSLIILPGLLTLELRQRCVAQQTIASLHAFALGAIDGDMVQRH